MRMNTICRLILVAVLALGSGCAKPDWIDQTLMTVDVTGTWRDSGGTIDLTLEQQGSKVTGSMVCGASSPRHRAPSREGSMAPWLAKSSDSSRPEESILASTAN